MRTQLRSFQTLILVVILTVIAGVIALPPKLPLDFALFGRQIKAEIGSPQIDTTFLGRPIQKSFEFKQGLDIQGGMQVVLRADMSSIPDDQKQTALEAARAIMMRRVDLFGVNEPVVQTSKQGDEYRIIVELAGVDDPNQALQLIGTTAQLDFRLESTASAEATASAVAYFSSFQSSGLTGQQLNRATVQFNPQTGEPEIGLEFNAEGTELFGKITTEHVGKVLAIFIDDFPVALPTINTPILNGQASMTGGFTIEEARQLAIQLNAGALPVPVEVLEQRTIGASLGQASVQDSVRAGLIGLGLVIIFMIALYGLKGVLAAVALGIYAILTIAVYKLFGVTLTLPGIAGLLLSIGMAVDANILIFERIKEEVRSGRAFEQALETGFGRAWDSIKDANIATIMTALILINPMDFPFLNTSGLVRGFGITLLIGVLISLFTGIVVTRTLMRLFLKE
jgi:preprotein translocase subunit SecD